VPVVVEFDVALEVEFAVLWLVPELMPVLSLEFQPLEFELPFPPVATPGMPPPTLLLDPDSLDDPLDVPADVPKDDPDVLVLPSVKVLPEVLEALVPTVFPAAID